MGDKSGISWTDATINAWRGCSKISEGCKNCYAIRQVDLMAKRDAGKPGVERFEGLVKEGNWTGEVKVDTKAMAQPLRWQKGRKIFVNSLSDTFETSVHYRFVAALFGVMAACPQHTFQILTKRPLNMLVWFSWVKKEAHANKVSIVQFCVDQAEFVLGARDMDTGAPYDERIYEKLNRAWVKDPTWPLPNVWLGVTTENQGTANDRIPLLLQTPAAVRFLSCEPLLGPIDLSGFFAPADEYGELSTPRVGKDGSPVIKWVIVGGESGPKFRPMDPAWALSIKEQCDEAGVAFFYKQGAALKSGQDERLPGKDGEPTLFQAFPEEAPR